MKKHTIIAAAITASLVACGTALATEGVDIQQNDPYESGNWRAQATTSLNGVDIQEQGNWSRFHAQATTSLNGVDIQEQGSWSRFHAQATTSLNGVDIQEQGSWNLFRAQPMSPLGGVDIQYNGTRGIRVNRRREAGLVRTVPALCESNLVRLYLQFRDIQLDCP